MTEKADKKRIYLVDVTNRDGVQTSRLSLAKMEKTMLNFYLNKLGVAYSEFGFPTTKHETNYLNGNLMLAKKGLLSPIKLSGWMRAIKSDVEEGKRLVPDLEYANLSISTSPQMIAHKFTGKGYTIDNIISQMTQAVDRAYELGFKEIGVNAEDASRTPLKDLIEFSKQAKKHGAVRFRYCDTLGFETPFRIYKRVLKIAKEVGIDIELHCHNDLGLAVANSVAGAAGAIDGGVNAYINVTVNGIGERAGNADLVSVILALRYGAEIGTGISSSINSEIEFHDSSKDNEKYAPDDRIKLKYAWRLATYAAEAFRVPIPVNTPGVGSNMFAHESGIHADGVLKNPHNYELYSFEDIGRGKPDVTHTGRIITVGEYGGLAGFKHVYDELGIHFNNDNDARKVLEISRYVNVTTQKPLTADELRFIFHNPEEVSYIIGVTPELGKNS
ncbi:MAG: homocitrate synthase [Nanoarchaeota archaeon]|nr:homocitrate synthase [Nanoarchaeota archaeon]